MPQHSNPLYTQLLRFLIIGAFALVIDFGLYELLNNYLNGLVAKALSFIAATQFAYAGDKYWTFDCPTKSSIEFLKFNSLYIITLSVNVAIHSGLTNYTTISPWIALLVASAASTGLNFLGQKLWIFTESPPHSP